MIDHFRQVPILHAYRRGGEISLSPDSKFFERKVGTLALDQDLKDIVRDVAQGWAHQLNAWSEDDLLVSKKDRDREVERLRRALEDAKNIFDHCNAVECPESVKKALK